MTAHAAMVPNLAPRFSRDRRARNVERAASQSGVAALNDFRDRARQKHATRPPILDMEDREVLTLVGGALTEEYGLERGGMDRLAEDADVRTPTAQNWTGTPTEAPRNLPQGMQLLRLIAVCPPLQALVRQLCSMESDLDPRFERAMHEAMRLFYAQAGGK